MTQATRSASSKLTGEERKIIALQALAGTGSISTLAARNGVSRPTVYRQMNRAGAALDELFLSAVPEDNKVLFMLPVTRQWLEQVILALTHIGHTSSRGVVEFMHDLLGGPSRWVPFTTFISRPRSEPSINAGIDLSPIHTGLHDELFQGSQPVLAGVDVVLFAGTRSVSRWRYLGHPSARVRPRAGRVSQRHGAHSRRGPRARARDAALPKNHFRRQNADWFRSPV
jgi:hypothetical protein